ncbi:hypothetical protein QQP08_001185 [Theobroma cacao]|nr:hypothetical protein QQP08_001185 [Theobroma cacao]
MDESPDGCTVATAAGDETLQLQNLFATPEVATLKLKLEPVVNVSRHGSYEGYDGYSGRSGYGGYESAVAMADMVDVEGLEDAALSVAVVLIIMEEVATGAALILARQSMLKLMRILTTNVAFARV